MTRAESLLTSKYGHRLLGLGLMALTCLSALRAQALPNLTPYHPQGWTGKIVVATTPDSTSSSATDALRIQPADPIYLNWAVANDGTAATSSRFFVAVLIDGIPWNGNAYFFDDPPLPVNYFVTWTNKKLPALSVGPHSISIVVDSTHVIGEGNELDNMFTVTVEVGKKAGGRNGAIVRAVRPSLPIPIGEHLGSSGGGLRLTLDPGPYVCAIHVPCTWKDVISVSGGSAPYHFAVGSFAAGAPPFGMTVNVSTGSVSGTPTVAKTYDFDVCVSDLVNDTVCGRTSIEVSGLPLITFTITPGTVSAGELFKLAWSTTNSTSVSIDGVAEPLNGSVSTSIPTAGTYTYTLTATGPGGTSTAKASVTVTGDSGSNEYANWDCNNQSQCIADLGHDVGSAGPFCSAAACDAWRQTFFAGATCTSQPQYTIYYAPPPGTCSNYPN